MPKTKILFVETYAEIGGGQVGLLDILQWLDRQRYQPVVMLPRAQGPLFKRVSAIPEVSVEILLFNKLRGIFGKARLPLYSPGAITTLTAAFRRIAPDIVHANHIHAGKYASPAARRLGIPRLVTIRNVYHDKPLRLNRIDGRGFYAVDVVV